MPGSAPVVYRHMIDDLERLRSQTGTKWTKHGPGVVPAFVADMDFDQAALIKQAITAMVERGDLGYQTALHASLVPAWLLWLDTHHGTTVPEDEVWSLPGVITGLETAMLLGSSPGDGVVVFTPIYYPFTDSILAAGRRIVDVPLGEGWRLDAGRFEAALDPETRVVLMSQPHNPIGRVFSAEEISAFADVVERHDLLVVSDEIWADLTHEVAHLSLVRTDERLRAHTVTLGSASKSFNISGLRCAVGHVGHPGVRERLRASPSHFPGGPSTLSVAATVAAWEHGGDWLDATRRRLTTNRNHVAERLAAEVPEVGFDPPEATYLAWLDLRGTSLGDDPAATLLDRAGVALSAGHLFGQQGVGCARLNFATNEELLDEILDRIIGAIRQGVTP